MFPVTIVKPKNLKNLWKTLPQTSRPRKYLAGGTDLVVAANNDLGLPCSWIDISGLPEICSIKETKTSVFIGAGVKISELKGSPVVKKWLPVLYSACSQFASPPLTNMATLGGNCANASPAADGCCALCCEGADVILERFGKKRRMPLERLFVSPKKTVLGPDELITGFEIKKTVHSGCYMKLSPRKAFAISKVAVAVALWTSITNEGTHLLRRNVPMFSSHLLRRNVPMIFSAGITMGAVGATVLRAARTEKFLEGKELSRAVTDEAVRVIRGECSPITDHRSSDEYRRGMTGVLLKRALEQRYE